MLKIKAGKCIRAVFQKMSYFIQHFIRKTDILVSQQILKPS